MTPDAVAAKLPDIHGRHEMAFESNEAEERDQAAGLPLRPRVKLRLYSTSQIVPTRCRGAAVATFSSCLGTVS